MSKIWSNMHKRMPKSHLVNTKADAGSHHVPILAKTDDTGTALALAGERSDLSAEVQRLSQQLAVEREAAEKMKEEVSRKEQHCRTLEELACVKKQDLSRCLEDLAAERDRSSEYATHIGRLELGKLEHSAALKEWHEREDELNRRVLKLTEELEQEERRTYDGNSAAELAIQNAGMKANIGALEKQIASLVASNAETTAELAAETQRRADSRKREQELKRRSEEARKEAGRAMKPLETALRELQAQKDLCEEVDARSRQRENELGKEIDRLVAAAAASQELLESTRKELEARYAKLEDSKRCRESELVNCITNLESQLGESGKELREGILRLDAAQSSGNGIRQEAEALKRELSERVEDLEKKTASLSFLNEHANRELAAEKLKREEAVELVRQTEQKMVSSELAAKAAAAKLEEESSQLQDLLAAQKRAREDLDARNKALAEEVEQTRRELQNQLLESERKLGEQRTAFEAEKATMASVDHLRAKSADGPAEISRGGEWYLRTGDGPVYGPVALEDLRTWSYQCRISPADQLSRDKETWIVAADVPELEMNWSVAQGDITVYGPISIAAMLQLVGEGNVPLNAQLRNKITGSNLSIAEVCLEELVSARSVVAGLRKDVDSMRGELAASKASHHGLTSASLEPIQAAQTSVSASIPMPPQTVRRQVSSRTNRAS